MDATNNAVPEAPCHLNAEEASAWQSGYGSALTAATQPQAAMPEGWKLVPEVVTDEMMAAYWDVTDDQVQSEWSAMLAAAPAPPSPQPVADRQDAEKAGGLSSHPVVAILLEVAGLAYDLMDNTEERGPKGHRELVIQPDDFDALSDAMDKLDALPDDQPGYVMGPAAKAAWALRPTAVMAVDLPRDGGTAKAGNPESCAAFEVWANTQAERGYHLEWNWSKGRYSTDRTHHAFEVFQQTDRQPAMGAGILSWTVWGVASRDDLADITDGKGMLIASMHPKSARAVVDAHNATFAPRPTASGGADDLYTCKGKGGTYELIGRASAAGQLHNVLVSNDYPVYRDTESGLLFVRVGPDFDERMEPLRRAANGAACQKDGAA